jgi:hypothetical protein
MRRTCGFSQVEIVDRPRGAASNDVNFESGTGGGSNISKYFFKKFPFMVKISVVFIVSCVRSCSCGRLLFFDDSFSFSIGNTDKPFKQSGQLTNEMDCSA